MKKTMLLFTTLFLTTNIFSQELLVESNNNFSFKFYRATKPDSSNYFISPFSLNIALSVANDGAKSTTRKEMDSLLSIKNIDDRIQQYGNLIRTTTNLEDPDFTNCIIYSDDKTSKNELFLANSLWINDEVDIEKDYINRINTYYKSEIFHFNKYDISGANNILNNWVSNKTNGKISEIKGIDSGTKLNIVNAIYFMGEWDMPFAENDTKEKKFYTLEKEKVDVKYMRQQSYYLYYEDPDIQSIYLPYKCSQFSMIVILPKERYGILEIEEKLNHAYFNKIESLHHSQEVILSFPKFRIESEIFPKEEIIRMGYPGMFSDQADFSGMSTTDLLKINEIIHKTFIEIDEKKTEAAAVSKVDAVVVGYGGDDPPTPPPPKIFNANHPFIFLIKDNRTNAILFTGRFVKE